ncbi:MAG: hypothetical protein HY922_14875 [Elusimicrobia bacterium]|nr:hypothetical protein [Elusimicrobiota bacterium]
MGDKKSVILLGAVMALVTCGALALLFVFMKPAGVKESELPGSSTTRFPDAGPRPTSGPMQSSSDARAPDPEQPQAGGPSGLGFINKDPNVRGSAGKSQAELSADAAKAAAKGDASGLLANLKEENAAEKKASEQEAAKAADFTRDVMQSVVDTVHDNQPGWYGEYLRNKALKKIADDYDATKDFPAFVAALAKSASFSKMLAAKAAVTGMGSLVKSLFSDPALAKKLYRVFDDNIKDPNLLTLVNKYGKKCRLPQDMLSKAGGGGSSGGAEEAPAQEEPPKKVRKPMVRPKLKLDTSGGKGGPPGLNSGGFGGKTGFGPRHRPQHPSPDSINPQGNGQNLPVNPNDVNLDQIKKLQQQGYGR